MNGILRILRNVTGGYTVAWVPIGSEGGVRPSRDFLDDAQLQEFLGHDLAIDTRHVDDALTAFRRGEDHYRIPEVWLSRDQAITLGLAPQ